VLRTLVFRRRLLLVAGVAAALYPMLQFINFRLPRKPRVVQINQNVGTDGSLTTDELIVFTDDAGAWAVSRTCTHLGCRIAVKPTENILECPCHQSRFTPQGRVIRGPAKKSLTRYRAEPMENGPGFRVIIQ
jgi:cytochrome b6-f complex iron-sulfur subunit